MEKSKRIPAVPMRLMCLFLALICMLGLLPSTAFAASPDTIVMEDCTHNGVYYESAALSTCWLHQMKFDFNGDTVMGFCADHGGGMGWSLNGHKWDSPKAINDQTVKIMMAYFYAHSRGIFTDQAHALGVDEVWGSDYTWTMNAWVQAVVWRYKQGTLNDPAAVCAEELMYVYTAILCKPGPLTEEERVLMRVHTTVGARILSHTNGTMRTAATVALQHHERIDGSGYLGLKGNEIHPHARLVAVADVFDALLSPRSYKRPWSIQRTSSYLSSLAGVELDEKLVGLLLNNLPQALKLYQDETRIKSKIRITADYAHIGKGGIGPCCCRKNSTLSIG